MIRKQELKGKNRVKVTFVLPGDQPYGAASVVGDFNDWDPLVNPFKRRSNQTLSTAVELEPGKRYAFRYLADGGLWFDEPEADGRTNDGEGGRNCILVT